MTFQNDYRPYQIEKRETMDLSQEEMESNIKSFQKEDKDRTCHLSIEKV